MALRQGPSDVVDRYVGPRPRPQRCGGCCLLLPWRGLEGIPHVAVLPLLLLLLLLPLLLLLLLLGEVLRHAKGADLGEAPAPPPHGDDAEEVLTGDDSVEPVGGEGHRRVRVGRRPVGEGRLDGTAASPNSSSQNSTSPNSSLHRRGAGGRRRHGGTCRRRAASLVP